MKKQKTDREYWNESYRLARQPDMYLADPTIVQIPMKIFLMALKAAGTELGDGFEFKDLKFFEEDGE